MFCRKENLPTTTSWGRVKCCQRRECRVKSSVQLNQQPGNLLRYREQISRKTLNYRPIATTATSRLDIRFLTLIGHRPLLELCLWPASVEHTHPSQWKTLQNRLQAGYTFCSKRQPSFSPHLPSTQLCSSSSPTQLETQRTYQIIIVWLQQIDTGSGRDLGPGNYRPVPGSWSNSFLVLLSFHAVAIGRIL